jgi:hypothetical protein
MVIDCDHSSRDGDVITGNNCGDARFLYKLLNYKFIHTRHTQTHTTRRREKERLYLIVSKF